MYDRGGGGGGGVTYPHRGKSSKAKKDLYTDNLKHTKTVLFQDVQSSFLSFNIGIAVIESITGMSWEQMVQDEVFTPLGKSKVLILILFICTFDRYG